jgi:Rieske Fe-S protein
VLGATTVAACGSSGETSSGGGGGGASASSSSTGPVGNFISIGKVSELKKGKLFPVDGEGFFIGLDDKGVYVMTAMCTHSFCDMTGKSKEIAGGIECGCHGSQFDLVGKVLKAPANKPLKHFLAKVENGEIFVDGGKNVDPSTRAPI